MLEYLRARTPADRQPIPPALTGLAGRRWAVAVTLRSEGAVVGRSIKERGDVCGNAIAAALAAMRSPALPDRITREALELLTVEVEVLGTPQPLDAEGLQRSITRGLTGLKLSRGIQDSYLLPSTAYLLNMDAQQMRRTCVTQLWQQPLTRANASRPQRWAVMAGRHYVGYPGGRTFWLYRGKILVPPSAIGEEALAAAARQVAGFLLRRQAKDGRYRVPGDDASMTDHLYATWAVARLARQSQSDVLAKSANAALGYAAKFVREAGEVAFVAPPEPQEQLAATALMVLASQPAAAADEQAARIRRKLLAGILSAIGGGGSPLAVLDGSKPTAAGLRHACLAWLALAEVPRTDKPTIARLQALAARIRAEQAPDAEAGLWGLRAALSPGGLGGAFDPRYRAEPCLPGRPTDEHGGLACGDEPPSAVTTGLAAAVAALARGRQGPPPGVPDERAALAARRFCYQMMLKPDEVFFAAAPEEWAGGVRERPDAARVTIRACAAAIEAFLAGAPK